MLLCPQPALVWGITRLVRPGPPSLHPQQRAGPLPMPGFVFTCLGSADRDDSRRLMPTRLVVLAEAVEAFGLVLEGFAHAALYDNA
jgi:hypothetical protein